MNFQSIQPDKSISLFVKNIWAFESADTGNKTNLQFFADGYRAYISTNRQRTNRKSP